MASLKTKIKDLASSEHITIAELERTLGFANGSISKWDKQSPSADRLQKVANHFDVSVDYLLGRESEESDPDVETLQRMAKNYTPEQRKRAIDILRLTIEHERDDSNNE